jgi:hypothetical protein
MKPLFIIAPHPDDEIIGCWQLLSMAKTLGRHVEVYYCYDMTPIRVEELTEASKALEFIPRYDEFEVSRLPEDFDLAIPSISDGHPHHIAVNREYRHLATLFYSIDMVNRVPISTEISKKKHEFLNKYYPSQKTLWKNDNKYFLFEEVTETDVVPLITVSVANITLSAPVDSDILLTFLEKNLNLTDEQLVSKAIQEFGKPLRIVTRIPVGGKIIYKEYSV